MAETAERLWTVEEFLARGEQPGLREELHAGRIVAMAPPRDRHGTIVGNAVYAIRRGLRSPCRVVVDPGVKIDDATLFVPDLVVACGPRDAEGRTVEPTLVVEVLSLGTRSLDLGLKADAYSELSACREIWLVDSERRWVRIWRRLAESWSVTLPIRAGGSFASAVLDAEIGLDELYADTGL